jgi:uncharacterized protein (DUF362 family)
MAVYLRHIHTYDTSAIKTVLADAKDALRLPLKRGWSVFLKPNIVAGLPAESGCITNPRLTGAVVEWLRDHGVSRIFVGEGPGVGLDEARVFKKSGYEKLCKRLGVELVNLHAAARLARDWQYGTIGVPQLAVESDLYINLPKAKTHGYTTVTLALKNQKGLLAPDDKKKFHHLGLHEPIVEFASIIQPHLTIVDGIVGIEGDGPVNGTRINSQFIVLSANQVEADATCARLMGFEPKTIDHIRMAVERGLGTMDPEVEGDSVESLSQRFKAANPEFGKKLNIYSWRNLYACSMCIDSFTEAVRLAIRNPRYWFTVVPKLAYWSLFGQLDIIQGKDARRPPAAVNMICFGKCTKDFAEREQCDYIAGCPPKPEKVLKVLAGKRLK